MASHKNQPLILKNIMGGVGFLAFLPEKGGIWQKKLAKCNI
jgi:hypothetical protein